MKLTPSGNIIVVLIFMGLIGILWANSGPTKLKDMNPTPQEITQIESTTVDLHSKIDDENILYVIRHLPAKAKIISVDSKDWALVKIQGDCFMTDMLSYHASTSYINVACKEPVDTTNNKVYGVLHDADYENLIGIKYKLINEGVQLHHKTEMIGAILSTKDKK